MAGSASNWLKPAAGPLKGQAVYLSRAQQEQISGAATVAGRRNDVLFNLETGVAFALRAANTERPAGTARPGTARPRAFAALAEADAWGLRHSQAAFARMDDDARANVRRYQSSWYDIVNPALRAGRPLTERRQAVVDAMDAAMTRTDRALVAYRGVSDTVDATGRQDGFLTRVWDQLAVGDRFTDPAFTSTTVDRRVAQATFTQQPDIRRAMVLTVEIPPGARAAYLRANPDGREAAASEWELVLARGATFQVVSNDPANPVVVLVLPD